MAIYAVVENLVVVNVIDYPLDAPPPVREQRADGSWVYYVLDDARVHEVGDVVSLGPILADIVENDPLLKALFKECFRLTNEVRTLRANINSLINPDPYTAAQAAQLTAAQYRAQVASQF